MYRRRKDNDTWHFCPNCSNWPKGAGYIESAKKPTRGELCNQCQAKRKRGECGGRKA